MGYWEQALLSNDVDFSQRLAGCAAVEPIRLPGEHPTTAAGRLIWDVAAEPGLADAYTYALETGVPNPGRDDTVITDAQLLAAATAAHNSQTPIP